MTELAIPPPYPGTIHTTTDNTTTTTPTAPTATATVPRRLPVSPTSVALALASPAVTVTMLALARHWSDHGARHSIGDMVPLGASAILGLALTAWAAAVQDAMLVGTCASLTAAALAVGMMAYPTGLSEPLIVTAVATVLGWALTRRVRRARHIRAERYAERQKDRDHEANVIGMQCQTAIEVAALHEQGATDREKLRQLGATKRAELSLDAAEYEALRLERDTRRRHFMTVSPTAAAALDAEPVDTDLGATARAALSVAAPLAGLAGRSCAVDTSSAVPLGLPTRNAS
ncbi:hypothetical protein [Catenulispora subtropica]|uniref:Uncharacterized protein n=1 Tax=Catenulispora subtropica TaxID=450798 RepID=A0ABP5BY82_9ACTN